MHFSKLYIYKNDTSNAVTKAAFEMNQFPSLNPRMCSSTNEQIKNIYFYFTFFCLILIVYKCISEGNLLRKQCLMLKIYIGYYKDSTTAVMLDHVLYL